MSRRHLLLVTSFILGLSLSSQGQNWSGVLDPSRAIDWSQAGVPGGIPSASWTQCGSTIAAGASASTINAAIQSCSANHYVLLGAGTFTLSSALVMRNNVVLRGSGAGQTFLVFTGTSSCGWSGAAICFSGNTQNPINGDGVAKTWSAGFSQGTTVITLNSTTNMSTSANGGRGTYLLLDQLDDSNADTGQVWECEAAGVCTPTGEGPSGGQRNNRAEGQYVRVTGINGNNVTISPGLYMPNWSASKSPQAWLATADDLYNSGIEDVSVQTNVSPYAVFVFFHASNCWMRGVRSIINVSNSYPRNHVNVIFSNHNTIKDNYFYNAASWQSTSYTIENYIGSDNLIENNIFHHVVAPIVLNGVATGTVIAYNYSVKTDWGQPINNALWAMIWNHAAGSDYTLVEGNVGQAYFGDMYHGNQHFVTLFRNYFIGWQPTQTSQLQPVIFEVGKRYQHAIGNVIGHVGTQTVYQGNGSDNTAITMGENFGGPPTDPLVKATIMRWGNWDVVTSTNTGGTNDQTGIRWCTANATPSASCTEDERGDGATVYPALASPSQTLSASFYLSSKPAWWGSQPWPAIGPDIANGIVYASGGSTSWTAQAVGGHANNIPALNCYKNVMGGPADGSGNPLNFNADSCYSSAGAPDAPSGLNAVVQ